MLTRQQMLISVNEIISFGRIGKRTHAQICKSFNNWLANEVASRTECGRLRYRQLDVAYVQGAFESLLQGLWKEVEFVYVADDGTFYGTSRNSVYQYWQDAGMDGSAVNKMKGMNVWIGTKSKF